MFFNDHGLNSRDEFVAARKARVAAKIAWVDFLRAVVAAVKVAEAEGYDHKVASSGLKAGPQDIQAWLAEAAGDEDGWGAVGVPLEGFSAATPYELCERYAAGVIDRETLLDELVRWPYEPEQEPEYLWQEVVEGDQEAARVADAYMDGLIDRDIYRELAERERQARES